METKKFNEETLSAVVRKKNILLVIEYCLENKIEFVVTPGNSNDEFMIGFVIRDLGTAVALGMSLKDLKIDLQGMPNFVSVNSIRNGKKSADTPKNTKEEETHNELATLENTLKFDMETA